MDDNDLMSRKPASRVWPGLKYHVQPQLAVVPCQTNFGGEHANQYLVGKRISRILVALVRLISGWSLGGKSEKRHISYLLSCDCCSNNRRPTSRGMCEGTQLTEVQGCCSCLTGRSTHAQTGCVGRIATRQPRFCSVSLPLGEYSSGLV